MYSVQYAISKTHSFDVGSTALSQDTQVNDRNGLETQIQVFSFVFTAKSSICTCVSLSYFIFDQREQPFASGCGINVNEFFKIDNSFDQYLHSFCPFFGLLVFLVDVRCNLNVQFFGQMPQVVIKVVTLYKFQV